MAVSSQGLANIFAAKNSQWQIEPPCLMCVSRTNPTIDCVGIHGTSTEEADDTDDKPGDISIFPSKVENFFQDEVYVLAISQLVRSVAH